LIPNSVYFLMFYLDTSDPAPYLVNSTQMNWDISSPVDANGTLFNITTPSMVGYFELNLMVTDKDNKTIGALNLNIEITCSDGIFCNGIERFQDGACVASYLPCGDGTDECFNDDCDEATDTCEHTHLPSVNCTEYCFARDPCSNFNCTERECGDNGCSGSCGKCPDNLACIDYKCMQSNIIGTCSNPVILDVVNVPGWPDYFEIFGNTSEGVHQLMPTCVDSQASEIVYKLIIPAGSWGFDIRVIGKEGPGSLDTVLEMRKNCLESSSFIDCRDDSDPPGNVGSRISGRLDAGIYYLYVDGYEFGENGPYNMTLRFVSNCTPGCENRYCGPDKNCGISCGDCGSGEVCNSTTNTCRKESCIPNCPPGAECGGDTCGGFCGMCDSDNGYLCHQPSRTCQFSSTCDNLQPICGGGCNTDQHCGNDCECYDTNNDLPDLVINSTRMMEEVAIEEKNFDNTSCSWLDRCIEKPGLRRLLKFSFEILNQGLASFDFPSAGQNPHLYPYSACRDSIYLDKFVDFYLLNLNGDVVLTRRKKVYCSIETHRFFDGHNIDCYKYNPCYEESIVPGWSAVYKTEAEIDCQYLDITDIAPGDYKLVVSVNTYRIVMEISYENNFASVNVTIPPLPTTEPTETTVATTGATSAATSGDTSGAATSGTATTAAATSGNATSGTATTAASNGAATTVNPKTTTSGSELLVALVLLLSICILI